ncbi:uncharacterized protein LOC114519201 isoform X1 [Dendronephthya gigantea]|uniref:uncharacterized protein LOC114519201 isoform X1 n=1 Tax=Dendronephthya gigantea TaxID=151771 RepID=UPI00106CCF0E|nr:uncharacterized protein LOC114519201 isoform X1 [Dendronephthya gigantea]
MDDKKAKQLGQLAQLILLLVVIASAPVWVPLGLIILVPTFFVTAGILATMALGLTTFLTLFLGVFGIPLLFSGAVTAMAYFAYKSCVKMTWKMHSLCISFYSHLDNSRSNRDTVVEKIAGNTEEIVQGFFAKLDSFLPSSTKGLPMISRFLKEESGLSCCEREQPMYEEESETETVISRTRKPSMQFPFPKASIPFVDLSADGDEIETFFNSVEELYAVICSLRKKTRNRIVMRDGRKATTRRATIS